MLRITFFIFCMIPTLLICKPFIVGRLMGQWGNQLFQIATTSSLAWDNDAEALFPDLVNPSDPVFNFPLNYKMGLFHLNTSEPDQEIAYHFRESTYTYSPIPYTPNMAIEGWFQSEKYFAHHKEKVIDLFQPSKKVVNYLTRKYRKIIDHPKTVAIHIRSYLKEDPNQIVYISYDTKLSYYENAISLFDDDHLFVIFSNDIKWCKKHFRPQRKNVCYIENELHIHDFYLMSFCKHQIICNSSFSWWAAYLNQNPDKNVIAPAVWFSPAYNHDSSDLVLEDWQLVHY